MRAAVYARACTSNGSQTCENQLLELRRYCDARGWIVYAEYTDEMSGAKDRRPGLDLLDARRARVQVVLCWAHDRIGRDLKHLLAVLEDLQSLNIPFVSLKEGLDLGSASGRLLTFRLRIRTNQGHLERPGWPDHSDVLQADSK